jgi:hypothetical protein
MSVRKMQWTRVVIGALFAISTASAAFAQAPPAAQGAGPQGAPGGGGRGRGEPPPPYRPAQGAKDLKSVLFNWTWYLGMLRGVDEHELIVSLEYQAKTGTVQVDGQPCAITKYRVSTNYQLPGQRTQYTCTRANGQAYSAIEVFNGGYAWNEDVVGAEIGGTKGKATPAPTAIQERLIRLWANPQGAAKAALLAARKTDELGPNPSVGLKDGDMMSGGTSLVWEGGKPVVTFPIPGVPGATGAATLDAKFMPEKIVVKNGATTTEFAYSNYADWNNPLNKVEVWYAGKITERRNGVVVREVTTTETETGSLYVVMPVPDSVKKAIASPASVPSVPLPTVTLAASTNTPRLPNGKPDMTGNWGGGGFNWRYGNRRCGPTQVECSREINQTMDFEFEAPPRFGPARPLYKPQHWDKIQQLDMWTNKEDPVMTCQPLGLPRNGPPRRIVQSDKDIIFFYGQYADGGGGQGEYRIMPTDGRKHNPKDVTTTYYGLTVGSWEGDTLVLDSVGFVDTTWLSRGGFFHTSDMHVIEKLTRSGNEIKYEVTVEDPEVLVEPFVMTPRILRLTNFPDAGLLPERGNCEVYELGDITSQIRH